MYTFKRKDDGGIDFFINNKSAATLHSDIIGEPPCHMNPHEPSSWNVFRTCSGNEKKVIQAAIATLYKAHTLLDPYLGEYEDPDFWTRVQQIFS